MSFRRMKTKGLAFILVFVLVLSAAIPIYAEDADTIEAGGVEESGVAKDAYENSEDLVLEGESIEGGEAENKEEASTTLQAPLIETQAEDELDTSKWFVEDFVYCTIEHTLIGCDYTRQFTVRGLAVAGFSESGLKKVEVNKELVIPAVSDTGEILVGVAPNAFEDKGLTSVTFPTGMLVDYEDTATNRVTRRGNFIIDDAAFSKNNLTSVHLPEGVLVVRSSAFRNNQLTTVNLPRTIWHIETLSFANNAISQVNFPKTCDFQLEMHGMAFASNNIKSVILPDYVAVIFKHVFALNPGMEPCQEEAPDSIKNNGGVVYMYTDNANFEYLDRIHHLDKATESTKSWNQKLIVTGVNELEGAWVLEDFTIEGTTITGLSEKGVAKRAVNKKLVLPDRNEKGEFITEIATCTTTNGLFVVAGEGFDTIELPNRLVKIGNRAFAYSEIKEISFPETLTDIGVAAFQNNKLTSIILPDSVTTLGGGAFGTNPLLERISLSKGLTTITAGAFGCSDANNWMTNLTSITLHEGLTSIGNNAFAGNNFNHIKIPSSVTSIGNYAFSTKNYLETACTVELSEGLETIGTFAFRNKVIERIEVPASVKSIKANTFLKEYSDGQEGVVTKVFLKTKEQYEDRKNFPLSEHHQYYLMDTSVWTAEDFTYNTMASSIYRGNDNKDTLDFESWVITGLSESGKEKIIVNKNLVIPDTDVNGKQVTGIGKDAFKNCGLESVSMPTNVKTTYTGSWESISERGNFVIGSMAFRGNNLQTLDIPEGVIYIGTSAFAANKIKTLKLPETLMVIDNQGFATNELASVVFPATSDFGLNLYNLSFGANLLKAVQLPDKIGFIHGAAFSMNTGKEEVEDPKTPAEKKSGVVHMYCTNAAAASSSIIDNVVSGKSKVQKLIIGEMLTTDKPWSTADFTYDEEGQIITGLSDLGKEKMVVNSALVLPSVGPLGTSITAIGDGVTGMGTFGYKKDTETYLPTNVILPEQLKSIGKFAFSGSLFSNIVLPRTLESIGQTAFQNSALVSLSIPDSVAELGVGAFTGSKELAQLTLSAKLKEIPQSAFTSTAIKEVIIPEGITKIGRSAFSGAGITSLNLATTVEVIDRDAFYNHQLEEVYIPASVTTIGQSAFAVVNESLEPTLKKLTLKEGLTKIENNAFRNSSLTNVIIPSTLASLHKGAFSYGGKVWLRTSNDEQLAMNEATTIGTQEVIYDVIAGSGWDYDDFEFADNVLKGWSAKGNQTRLGVKNLVLPDYNDFMPNSKAVTEIAEGAFKIPDCEIEQLKDNVESPNGMTSVRLPNTVQIIGKQAFEFNRLTEVDFATTELVEIGERAFKGNVLTKVHLPARITKLGEGAFTVNNITDLKLSTGLTMIPQGAFSMNIRLEQFEIPSGVTEIGDTAFAGARLTSLHIPASVTKIGRKAFHLHHLRELTIPGTVKEIGESAFEGTFKDQTLTSLTLGEGIEKIGLHAFKEGLLQEVRLPSSLTELGDAVFLNNTGYKGSNVVLCNTNAPQHLLFSDSSSHVIHYIGGWTEDFFTGIAGVVTGFNNLGNIYVSRNPQVDIPLQVRDSLGNMTNVTAIGNMAFKNQPIKGVNLPVSLVSIGTEAFAGTQLTSIHLPNGVKEVNRDAFANCVSTVELTTDNKTTADALTKQGLDNATVKFVGEEIKPDPNPTPDPTPTPNPTPGGGNALGSAGTSNVTSIPRTVYITNQPNASGSHQESETTKVKNANADSTKKETKISNKPSEKTTSDTVSSIENQEKVPLASAVASNSALGFLQKILYLALGMAVMAFIMVVFRKKEKK